MRYVYFTKSLRELDLQGVVSFLKDVGLDGADLAVRLDYPVHPDNALTELPRAAKLFQDEGLTIGLATAPTSMNDPTSRMARTVFEACQKAGVPAVKIGYFPYQKDFDKSLTAARQRMAGFAKLAAQTGVKACYHTHSGNNLGANGAAMRLLLQDLDPHHVGAFLDTGHVAVGGGPIRMELDIVRSWLSVVAIKDMAWDKASGGRKPPGNGSSLWRSRVVPAGEGIVRWDEFAQGIKECRFNGTISLHGEYEARDLEERKRLAKQELEMIKSRLG